jgi:hypothetical protein
MPLHPIATLAARLLVRSRTWGRYLLPEAALVRITEALHAEMETDRLFAAVSSLLRLSGALQSVGSTEAADALFDIAYRAEPALVGRVEALKGMAQDRVKLELEQFRRWTGKKEEAPRAPRFDGAPRAARLAVTTRKERRAFAVKDR